MFSILNNRAQGNWIYFTFGQIFNQFTFIDFLCTQTFLIFWFACTNFTLHTCVWDFKCSREKFHLFLVSQRTLIRMYVRYTYNNSTRSTCLMFGCYLVTSVFLFVVIYQGTFAIQFDFKKAKCVLLFLLLGFLM